jgi:hypothetical protein
MMTQGFGGADSTNPMLIAPESFAAKPESLSEQLFIERSLVENKFWLRRPTISRPCCKRSGPFPANGSCFRGKIKGQTAGRTKP